MKQRTIISLEPLQMHTLKRLSSERHESVSVLIRRAINRYIQNEKKDSATLILEGIAKHRELLKKSFSAADRDLSSKIDDIVYGS